MHDPKHRLAAWAFALLIGWPAAGVLAQGGATTPAAKSVVKITCRAGSEEWRGTGFAWDKPTEVVTALHVVAGCKGIVVWAEGTGKQASAKVRKVLIDDDLALIELSEPIGLSPLKTGNEAPATKDYTIWGYPQNVKTMQGDELRFSRVLKPSSTLADVMTDEEHTSAVGEGGYPKLKTVILRIGSTIQPGHSGAPIFDASGAVVGIGDGGLHEGIKSINWAIPTSTLQRLMKSTETPPTTRPKQVAHFSIEVGRPEPAAIDLSGDDKLQFMFSSSVQEIATTASKDEAQDLARLIEEAAEDFKEEREEQAEDEDKAPHEQAPDLRKQMLDVYADPETGATIAVPKGMKPKFDPETHMVTASSAGGHVTMYIQVVKSGGPAAFKQFESKLDKIARWKPDPEIKDDRYEEPGVVEVEKERYAGDDPENPDKTMFYSASVDGESFLGTAIVTTGVDDLSLEDQLNEHLMEMCVALAGFSVD